MSEWIHKTMLIGEAHSLDHIANLPSHTFTYDDTKYLGGLRMAIKFGLSMEAREFLEDKTRWQEWFKWMMLEENKDIQYERLAWLKITGVPLRYWDTEIFSKVAIRFGKVIIPFENIHDLRDLSMGKVGVITSKMKWINEEVQIRVNDALYLVGVVEYIDDWSPFKPCQFDKEDDKDLEEGEFRSGAAPVTLPEEMCRREGIGKPPWNFGYVNDTPVEFTGVSLQETVNMGNLSEAIGIPHVTMEDVANGGRTCRMGVDPGKVVVDSDLNVSGHNNDIGPSGNSSPVPNSTSSAHNASLAQRGDLSSRSERGSSERKIKRRKRARGCRSPHKWRFFFVLVQSDPEE
ncbi:unnamed protein product [Lactuca virosa]|uniref:DUF4283 domain-containing protein n=1 Tax=Lactuca virosa TaxID=75947 RepID=A0AAU9LLX1_9ASTR|nr:unnamed protein product [Lactuca virosa]